MRYIESMEYAGESEMAGIRKDKPLNESLKRGLLDAEKKRGRFI